MFNNKIIGSSTPHRLVSVSAKMSDIDDKEIQSPDSQELAEVKTHLQSGQPTKSGRGFNGRKNGRNASTRKKDHSNSLIAEFDRYTKELYNRIPLRFIHWLEGRRNFMRDYISAKNYTLNLNMGISNNTVIYMGEQLYYWFKESRHSSKVQRSLYEGYNPPTSLDREGAIKNNILYYLMYHITYILYHFEQCGNQLNDKFLKKFKNRKTIVGVLTLLRVCNTYFFSFNLGCFGNLNITIVSKSIEYLKLYKKGEIYNEIVNKPNIAQQKFNLSITQLQVVFDVIGISMYPIAEELKFENGLGIIGEVLTYKDKASGKFILLSFLESHNDVKRAAFSTAFDLRLEGDAPIDKSNYFMDDDFKSQSVVVTGSNIPIGTPVSDVDEPSVVVGEDIALNVGTRYPVPSLENLAPFEIFYFFGMDYQNATIPYSYAGDSSDLDSDANPTNNNNPSNPNGGDEGLISSAKRQIGEFVSDVRDYGTGVIKEVVIPSMLMSAAGLIPGGAIAKNTAINAVRSTRAARNLRIGSNVVSHRISD